MGINLNQVLDLRDVDWATPAAGSSAGILPKGVVQIGSRKYAGKLGSYSEPFGIYGREALIEWINARIGRLLELPVLPCQLRRCRVVLDGRELLTEVALSRDYTRGKYRAVSVEKWYEKLKRSGESPLDVCKRYHLQKAVYEQFVYDYIICNLDRHGKNTEILLRPDGQIGLAPFFDNSLTYVTNRPENEIAAKTRFNESSTVNNFIGTRNLRENLFLIDAPVTVRGIRAADRARLFQGLSGITDRAFRDFVWDMLMRRVDSVKQQEIPFIQWK